MNKVCVFKLQTGVSVIAYHLDMTISVDWGVKQQTKQAWFPLDLTYISK